MTRTDRMRWLTPDRTSGRRSLQNPGSMPLKKTEAPPSLHAASSGLDERSVGGRRVQQLHERARHDVDPGLEDAGDVGDRLVRAQVGRGRVADDIGGEVEQGVDVVGGGDPDGARPASSPASRPTLSGEWTQRPTSSRSGWSRIARRACIPTWPVDHCTTRYGMAGERI